MKNTILSIAIILIALTGKSQSKEFATAMGESLGQYTNCKSIEDFQALGNKFGLIANAEKAEWLPLYYQAHCYIIMSFMEPTDAAKKDSYLDVAEKSLAKMIELAPNEAEVYALQSMFYSARLVVSPMERGQKYGALSAQAVGKALGLEASNPRAKFIKLRNDMGAAQFFGKDPKEYCPQASELLASWDSFNVKSPLYPSWGKEQVAEIVSGCK
ncbi:MAG: hypothetical protein Q7U54_04620 [Bacteroidales bacterium]|nr:hypothetical protein [Bacteroidales bacterium]